MICVCSFSRGCIKTPSWSEYIGRLAGLEKAKRWVVCLGVPLALGTFVGLGQEKGKGKRSLHFSEAASPTPATPSFFTYGNGPITRKASTVCFIGK